MTNGQQIIELGKHFVATAAELGADVAQRLSNTFQSAAAPCTIDCRVFLNHLSKALQDERIEPYQASLFLLSNASMPFKLGRKRYGSWQDFLPALIDMHNDVENSFVKKKRVILRDIMRAGIASFDLLRQSGLTRNHDIPDDPDHIDTKWEVFISQDDNIEHNRIPKLGKKDVPALNKIVIKNLIQDSIHRNSMSEEQACVMLAINVHAMDRRRDGTRYLDHVMAVAGDSALTPRQRHVALLHDVLENSNWIADDLRDIGLDENLIRSVEHITKRPDEKIYLHFIQRVSQDADALAVKLADINHNIQTAKPNKAEKYKVALSYLYAVQKGVIEAGASIEDFAKKRGMFNPAHFLPEEKKARDTAASPSPGQN